MLGNKIVKNLWLVWAVGFLFMTAHTASAQNNAQIKIAFLNTQNLFDTINNPDTNDGEFTPHGSRRWNSEKYVRKIEQLAELLTELNAEVVGLCEVENREVVEEVVAKSGLAYDIVHYDSRDARGIDVCMLYKRDLVDVVSSEMLFEELAPRGILRVEGVIRGEEIIFYTAHLPSKRGGSVAARKRNLLLQALELEIGRNISKKLVVMGDMNTEPISIAGLTNIAKPLSAKGLGTYCYRGVWSMIDQFLLSPSLIAHCSSMIIHRRDISPMREKKFEQLSDHQAIYFILKL